MRTDDARNAADVRHGIGEQHQLHHCDLFVVLLQRLIQQLRTNTQTYRRISVQNKTNRE